MHIFVKFIKIFKEFNNFRVIEELIKTEIDYINILNYILQVREIIGIFFNNFIIIKFLN